MTKINVIIVAFFAMLSAGMLQAKVLTTTEKAQLQQQLNTVKAHIVTATKNKNNDDLAKLINEQNKIKRKLAGR